jgi:beta-galactosidase
MKLVSSWVVAALAAQAAGAAISHKLDGFTIREHADPAKRALLQKYVRYKHARLIYPVVLMLSNYR